MGKMVGDSKVVARPVLLLGSPFLGNWAPSLSLELSQVLDPGEEGRTAKRWPRGWGPAWPGWMLPLYHLMSPSHLPAMFLLLSLETNEETSAQRSDIIARGGRDQ
jgi:hypothetical protein